MRGHFKIYTVGSSCDETRHRPSGSIAGSACCCHMSMYGPPPGPATPPPAHMPYVAGEVAARHVQPGVPRVQLASGRCRAVHGWGGEKWPPREHINAHQPCMSSFVGNKERAMARRRWQESRCFTALEAEHVIIPCVLRVMIVTNVGNGCRVMVVGKGGKALGGAPANRHVLLAPLAVPSLVLRCTRRCTQHSAFWPAVSQEACVCA